MKTLWFVALSIALVGCGEITNEDLLFLAAVPSADELAIVLEEGEQTSAGQSLRSQSAQSVGDDSGTFRTVSAIAESLNTSVDFVLGFVNELGRDGRPTLREADRRVWGPFRDGSGPVLRLEIVRDLSLERPRYTFCLHVARSGDPSGDPACSESRQVADRSNGWRALLYGSYSPLNAVEGARTGRGIITLDFEAGREAGLELNPGDEGRFSFEYAFAEGGVSKDIEVVFTPREALIPGYPDYFWSYSLGGDGDVRFYVEFADNAEDTSPENLELLQIDSCWGLSSEGRATFTVSEGDIPPSFTAQGTECWSAAQTSTYVRLELGTMVSELGDPASCRPACQ